MKSGEKLAYLWYHGEYNKYQNEQRETSGPNKSEGAWQAEFDEWNEAMKATNG